MRVPTAKSTLNVVNDYKLAVGCFDYSLTIWVVSSKTTGIKLKYFFDFVGL